MPETDTFDKIILDTFRKNHYPPMPSHILFLIKESTKKWVEQKKQKLENDMSSTSELAKVGLLENLLKELEV